MKKYEIRTDDFELRFGKSKDSIPAMSADEIFTAYNDLDSNDPKTEASFDSIDEAKSEFDKYYSNYGTTWAEKSLVFWLLRGRVAWIEEVEDTEDGEFDYSLCTDDVSAEAYIQE